MSTTATTEQLAESITDDLRSFGTGSRQGHRPSAQKDFGVYTGDLRSVVKTYRKRVAEKEGRFVHDLALALIAHNVVECRQVAYELIAGHREAREMLNVARVERLGQGIDNWACVDLFCGNIAGPAWMKERITDETIMRWSRSDDLWWRRAAVVATVPFNQKSKGGTGDTRRTLMLCSELVADPEEMVQKAISWALRELVPWDRAAAERFLEEHAESVSARVRREVRKKLETGKKNG